MKKKTGEELNELRPEYDLTKLKFVGRGIYAKRYRVGNKFSAVRAGREEGISRRCFCQ